MAFIGGSRDNKIYTIIALAIIIIIIYAIFLNRTPLRPAYIDNKFLDSNWSEDINERESDSQLLGLEELISYKYSNNNNSYPAYVSITSLKTLFMISEQDLIGHSLVTILKGLKQGIVINNYSRIDGERVLDNEHKTMYII